MVFIVLPREVADTGVKGAIKVEWVRKGEIVGANEKGPDQACHWSQ